MDESSDFQDKKISLTDPKSSNSKSNKAKVKKPIKRIRGQKDIRTVLKSKKNELIAYSKEFDNVCKQSGVDIDPEQLQLAIALSNSLQDTNKDSNTLSSVSNSQSRIGKIRTTLKQYGFKVPETRKNAITGSRGKKHRKNYKLLTITDSERLQIIADKYAQVLIQNLDKTKHFEGNIEFDIAKLLLIDIATNIPYKYLRNNDIFYVNDLVEKSSSNGSLLRDWSNIPGRPVSPAKTLTEDNNMNITEIECSQEELDIVLSGTIKCSERVFRSKMKSYITNESDKTIDLDDTVTRSDESPLMPNVIIDVEKKENTYDVEIIHHNTKLLTQYRSCSPDLFDDEASVIDKTDIIVVDDYRSDMKSQDLKSSVDVMDFTECVNIRTQNSTKVCSQLSQKCDNTKRKSNDFMEITECVATISQPILENPIDIDLTRNIHNNDDAIKEKDGVESLDLTQSSDSSVDLPFVQIDYKQPDKSCDDTIILNENEYLGMNIDSTNKENVIKLVDLTQEEKPTRHSTDSIIEEFVHEHSSEHIATTSNEDSAHKSSKNLDIDLTQSTDSSADTNKDEPLNNLTHKTYESDNRYDISIDYDDLFDKVCESVDKVSKTSSKYTMRSSNTSVHNLSTNEEISQKPLDILSSSQNSEIFEISDGELDYSLHKSRLEKATRMNFDIGGMSVIDNNTNTRHSVETNNMSVNDSLPVVEIRKPLIDDKSNRVLDNERTPVKNNHDYIVKTDGVTPMPDYESMSSPERKKELDKYGLKPFKRKRAIKLLTHLYNQTHPLTEPCSSEELHSPSKKLKMDVKQPNTSPKTLTSPVKEIKATTPKKLNTIFGLKDCAKENECSYQQTCSPTIKEVYCDESDWVFQRREKAKVHSCRVPLHIAFHNYVSSRRELREAILRYEPINIDVVHKDLIHCGYRYDPKELLKFLDKKCITVKTTDNNTRNNKR